MAAGALATSTLVPDERFARPAGEDALRQAAAALTANGFTVETLDDAAAARARVRKLLPKSAAVFTSASETLRVSGIEDDRNAAGRYRAVRLSTTTAAGTPPDSRNARSSAPNSIACDSLTVNSR
jgi:hypothetical protein